MRSQDLEDLVRCLDDGGVALMATDTLPGLHARIDAPEAVAHIAALKGRDAAKPLLVLAASFEAAAPWLGERCIEADRYAERCWPGPFTLILAAGAAAPTYVTAERGTLAVRVPEPQPLRDMLSRLGVPLVSTSANAAGEAPATTVDEAASEFGDRVDLVSDVVWGSDGGAARAPSTLLDLSGWPPRVLRTGAAPAPTWRDLR